MFMRFVGRFGFRFRAEVNQILRRLKHKFPTRINVLPASCRQNHLFRLLNE
jgi:hypothetical protein